MMRSKVSTSCAPGMPTWLAKKNVGTASHVAIGGRNHLRGDFGGPGRTGQEALGLDRVEPDLLGDFDQRLVVGNVPALDEVRLHEASLEWPLEVGVMGGPDQPVGVEGVDRGAPGRAAFRVRRRPRHR